MEMSDISEDGEGADESRTVSISLSGGGYRATAFAAGALLAVADSSVRSRVASISSVSGGSIASAVSAGGLQTPRDGEPDPMGRRVKLLAGLVQSEAIRMEALLGYALTPGLVIGVVVAALFVVPAWLTLDDPTFLACAVFGGIGGGFALTAFPHSWYAVQGVVETLVAEARGRTGARNGTVLDDVAGDDAARRIFCATDLSSGSHVYLTPGYAIAPHEVGTRPNVYLADVVAASACFPGFRPIVFRRSEFGLSSSATPSGRPVRHRAGSRLLLGTIGVAGLSAGIAAILVRILGPLNQSWTDLAVAVVMLAAGLGIALLSARSLRVSNNLVLVDGGVCDNLGAAFALLSKDDRYADLPQIAGMGDAGLMLVIDASKPFEVSDEATAGVAALIPLRLRGAQRSILKLLGNANASARRHVIKLLLHPGEATSGAVISITDIPAASDDLDWREVVQRTAATPTTLSKLDVVVTRDLILQAYRLAQAALAAQGVRSQRDRTRAEIDDLVGGVVAREVASIIASGRGPYARQAVRVRRLSRGAYIAASLCIVAVIARWWWLGYA